MRITKASVKNRSLIVEYTDKKSLMNSEGEVMESVRDVNAKCQDICHDSLIEAFDRLKVHAVLIADVRDAIKVENAISSGHALEDFDLEELKNISIIGFVVVGEEENGSEGAMIIFQKTTGTRILNITTPTVKFEDPDYAYGIELHEVISNCIFEVEEYLDGKVAVKQLEMNFDEGFDADGSPQLVKEPKVKKSKKAKNLAEAFGLDPKEAVITITEHQEVE